MSNPTYPLLPAFQSGDGAHWGITDWYTDKEDALTFALAARNPFDTGWYSSKKEIASARVWSDGITVWFAASCSDDFDTTGHAEGQLPAPVTVEQLTEALDKALDAAEQDRTDNALYVGWSLLKVGTGKRSPRCMDYLILPAGDGHHHDRPPGDSYYFWGWSNDHDGEGRNCVEKGISKKVAAQLRSHAESADRDDPQPLRVGAWQITPWDYKEPKQ